MRAFRRRLMRPGNILPRAVGACPQSSGPPDSQTGSTGTPCPGPGRSGGMRRSSGDAADPETWTQALLEGWWGAGGGGC